MLAPQGRGVKSGIARLVARDTGSGTPYPNTVRSSEASLELWRIPLISGSRFTPALSPGCTVARAHNLPRTDWSVRSDCGLHCCCKPVWLPCRACGTEQGVERKGEEPGRPAGGACSLAAAAQPARCPPRSDSGALCGGPRLRGAATPRPPSPDLASPRRPALPGPSGPLAILLARGAAGRKGNAGTRTPAAARAHCTLAAARPRRRASEPSVAPRQGPAPARPTALPRLRPARRPPQPPENPRHPDNLPAVAQLVSAAKAPARQPKEVSFRRVPGNPAYTLPCRRA